MITFKSFNDCLKNRVVAYTKNNTRSNEHLVHSVAMNKVTLSPFDDRRIVIYDGIKTLPYVIKELVIMKKTTSRIHQKDNNNNNNKHKG